MYISRSLIQFACLFILSLAISIPAQAQNGPHGSIPPGQPSIWRAEIPTGEKLYLLFNTDPTPFPPYGLLLNPSTIFMGYRENSNTNAIFGTSIFQTVAWNGILGYGVGAQPNDCPYAAIAFGHLHKILNPNNSAQEQATVRDCTNSAGQIRLYFAPGFGAPFIGNVQLLPATIEDARRDLLG